ncbi:hypothetical protein [Micromonospora sp. DT231]|uniref:hypothetical protein n=1 Tax=Micromonospora sp. DT231 TaxID=3416526 RepID=UPI003CEB7087
MITKNGGSGLISSRIMTVVSLVATHARSSLARGLIRLHWWRRRIARHGLVGGALDTSIGPSGRWNHFHRRTSASRDNWPLAGTIQ